jgi:hypothetical protein
MEEYERRATKKRKEREDKVIHFNLVEVSMEAKSWLVPFING